MKNELRKQLSQRLIEEIREELYGEIRSELKDEFLDSFKSEIRQDLMDERFYSDWELYREEVYEELYEEEVGNAQEIVRDKIRKSINWLEEHYICEVEERKRQLRNLIFQEFSEQADQINRLIDRRIWALVDEAITRRIDQKLTEGNLP